LEKYVKSSLNWAYLYYGHIDCTQTHIILMYKYIFLSYIVRLIIICSPQSYNIYDMDPQTIGSEVYHNGQILGK